MESSQAQGVGRYELLEGLEAIEVAVDGLRHPRSMLFGGRIGGRCLSPWSGVTDVAIGPLGLRLGTRNGVFFLRRRFFRDRRGPEALADEILARVAAAPGGEAQLAHMAELERRARRAPPLRASRGAALACLVAFAFQIVWAPYVDLAGVFSATLVSLGELWRLATANLLHAGLFHLFMNTLGLAVIGGLAERSLGSAATLFVMGVSAAGAMLGSWAADYPWALGASGVVAGLAGALLWVELRHPETVPAAWRLPRRIFVAALAVESLLLLLLPAIAHAAHLGGFAGGAAAAAVAGAATRSPGRRRGLVLADAALGALLLASVAQAATLAATRDPLLVERRAEALLAADRIPAMVFNNEAWLIAISEDPDPRELEAARALAERAVAETGRQDPNVLDTLAEVHFASGRIEDALDVIDEAIALAPGERYFREQRRRYTGERAADDRPDPPPWESEPGPEPELPEPGIRV